MDINNMSLLHILIIIKVVDRLLFLYVTSLINCDNLTCEFEII